MKTHLLLAGILFSSMSISAIDYYEPTDVNEVLTSDNGNITYRWTPLPGSDQSGWSISSYKGASGVVWIKQTVIATRSDGEFVDIMVRLIGSDVFQGNQAITELDVQALSGYLDFGDNAFKGCTALKTVDLSNKAGGIRGNGVFEDCTALETVRFSNLKPIESVGDNCFKGCVALNSVTNLNGTSESLSLGASAFEGCTALKSIDFNRTGASTTVTLGERCFYGSGLESVTLPVMLADGISADGTGSQFAGCASLKSVDMSGCTASLSLAPSMFQNCTQLATVNLNVVSKIGTSAFAGCSSLQHIGLPSSLTDIGESAFQNAGLTEVTVPASVTSVGDAAFRDTALNNLTIEGTGMDNDLSMTIGDYAFYVIDAAGAVDAGGNQTTSLVDINCYRYNAPITESKNVFSDPTYNNGVLHLVQNRRDAGGYFDTSNVNNAWQYFMNVDAGVPVGVDGVTGEGSAVSVKANGNVLSVSGAESMEVYTVEGRRVYVGVAGDITLAKGIYVVVVEGKSVKIMI